MFGQQFGYGPGTVPNQQARLAALQQYQMQQQMAQPMSYPQPMMAQPMQMPMQGRMVATIEEAKVAQVPVDGSCIYFPCPSEHKIFVKSMDLMVMQSLKLIAWLVIQKSSLVMRKLRL